MAAIMIVMMIIMVIVVVGIMVFHCFVNVDWFLNVYWFFDVNWYLVNVVRNVDNMVLAINHTFNVIISTINIFVKHTIKIKLLNND